MKRFLFTFLLAIVLVGVGCVGAQNNENQPPDNNGSTDETPVPVSEVQIYLIALSDGSTTGPIGCGDSLVAVTRVLPTPTTDTVRVALEELFGIKTSQYGQSGLYNALASSPLSVDKVTETATTVRVDLKGGFVLGGACDNPRAEAQIVETAELYSGGKPVEVFVEGKALKDVLSLK